MNRILFICFAICLWSCGQQAAQPTDDKATSTPINEPAASVSYPPISTQIFNNLMDSLTNLDFILYKNSFSMNIDNKSGLQAFLSTIDPVSPIVQASCKPIGRMFLEHEGSELLQADFYYEKGCTYFIFLKNQKPLYANVMNKNGLKYFNQVFKQANATQLILPE